MPQPQNEKWTSLLVQAETGDSDAQYEVGMSFHEGVWNRTGIVVEQNYSKAFDWFSRSYKNGNLEAMVLVADYLSDGIAGEKNMELAIDLYQDAIAKGSGVAANNLATVWRDQGEFEKAFDYYLLSEKLSGISYSLKVGLCYFYGTGVQEDKRRAFEIFKAISEIKENSSSGYEIDEANFMLGQMYLQGIDVEQSVEKARQCLELADADSDHCSAQAILRIIGRSERMIK